MINQILKDNEGLVRSIALGFKNSGLELDDLLNVGRMGLWKAYQNFDESKGTKLSTFAYSYIQQEMRDAIQKESKPIRITHEGYEVYSKISKFISSYEDMYHSYPSYDEISESTGYSVSKVITILNAFDGVSSLDECIDNDGFTLADVTASNMPNPEEVYESNHNIKVILDMIDSYDEKDRYILRHRLPIEETMTNVEIGKHLGITDSAVAARFKKAIAQLQGDLKGSNALYYFICKIN